MKNEVNRAFEAKKTIYSIQNFAKRLVMMLAVGVFAVNVWGATYTYDFHSCTASSGGAMTYWYSDAGCNTHLSKFTSGTTNQIISSEGTATIYYKDASIPSTAFTISAGNTAYFMSGSSASTAFFWGKTAGNYITLPTYSGEVITKVKVTTSSGVGKSIEVNIYSGTYAASTSYTTTGCTPNGCDNTQYNEFTISDTYQASSLKLQIVTDSKNFQITEIQITTASACDKSVTVSNGGSSTNGTITSITTSPVATCSSTASDRRVSIVVTPSTGYVAPEALSVGTSTGTVNSSKVSRTDNGNGTFTFVYGYNQNDNGSISYNAACVGKQCTLIFDQNSGTGGQTSNLTATYGSAMPAISGVPTREHYDFEGYYDGAGGSGTQYYTSTGASARSWDKNTTSNTTLYAKWTEHDLINYRTVCCDILDAIDGEATLTQGGNSVTISGWSDVTNVGTYTVKMYKKNGASWDLVSGSTSGGSAGAQGTRTGITSASKSVTYTGLVVESEYKFTVQAIAGSSAYCDGVETAITEINSTDVSSTPFKFRYSIYVDNGSGSGWAHHYIEPTGNTDEGSVDIDLSAHITSYQFKIAGGFSGWWGQTGTDNIPASTEWTLNGSNNVKLNTGAGGSYTFTVDYSGTTNPKVEVTFPSADQGSGYKIYFDKSVITGWGSTLKYRIGNGSHNQNQNFTLVTGTDNFYVTTTPSYGSMDAWQIANNVAWSGTNSIYNYYHGDDNDITKATVYLDYAIDEDVTIVPTSKKNTENGCDFWNVNKTSGMLTHTATITTPSHGTINIAYTDVSGTSQNKTATTADLAHRTVLTITATPSTGYSLSALTVDGSAHTSGNTYILDDDATIAATFTAQTSTVTLKPNGGSGSDQTVLATYDAAMPLVTTADKTPAIAVPSRDHYSFTGYFDNTSGGTQYYSYTSSTLASARTWDKTGSQNLYAQWLGDLYTITYKDKGDVAFSGSHADGYPTNHRYGTATTLKSATKTGYTFDGWFSEKTCSGDAMASVGATAYTDNFTLYGSWTPKTTTITLDRQSGTGGTASVSATYDANTNLTTAITKPTRANYVFKGYYSATSGGGVQVIDADGNWLASVDGYTGTGKIWKNENAAVTLYACWAPCYTVTWYVNGVALSGDDLGSAPTSVETGTKPGNVPPAPADNTLNNCANKFMGWSAHSWGSTPKGTGTGEYDDLFTAAGSAPTISAATDFYAVFAERTGAADVDDVLWSEDWTDESNAAQPDGPTNGGGSKFGSATIEYEWTAGTGTSPGTSKVTTDNSGNLAGGTSPEAMIGKSGTGSGVKGGKLIVSGIPNGGASAITVSYKQNANGMTVTASGTGYSGSKNSSSKADQSFDVTVGSASTFTLTFQANGNSNVRLDDIVVKVKSVSYSNYVTQCAANQVRVTYEFNGGNGTACTEGVTTKSASYSICSTEPTKTGYDFEGWSDGTNTYDAGATYNLQATTEFTASWEAQEYDITYKDQGDVAYSGTNSGSLVATHTYGTPTSLVDGDKGVYYRFEGWYTESTCSGDPITIIGAYAITNNITLYAKWTRLRAVTWTVNKDPDVTYVEDGSALTFPDDPDVPTACSSTKEFVGWITSEIEDETDAEPAFISAGGAVNADATYHAVFAHALGTAISATEVTSFTTIGVESYCGSSNGMKDNGDYILKNSVWTSLQMADVKVKIKVYHVSNKSADVLRISLIDKYGVEVVGTDLSTTIFDSNISKAAYSEYVTLTPTSAVTGFKVAMKKKNSGGTCVDKVTYEVVPDYEAYATYCCGDKIDAPDVTATKRATAADASTITLSWDAVTGATGYKVRWGVDGEWEDNGTSRTYVKAGLAPDTYTWYVKAKYDEEDYCGAEIVKGSTTVNTAYSVTYDANTIGYAGDVPAVSWYEPSLSVTVSTNVLTKSRYHWDGWTPYNSSTPITVTAGAFTMPSANVTVKGGWTEVLSGDAIYITSANGVTTMSSMSISVTRATYKSGTMTISNQIGDQGGTFHAVITGAAADALAGLSATVKIEYTPSKAKVTESATMTAVIGSESYDFTVYGRSLPTDFVIVAKVGGVWTALPADATTSGLQLGYSLTLDDATTPTKATLAPAAALFNYYAHSAKDADYIRLAGKENSKALWSSTSNGIKVNAAIGGGYATGNQYEWKLSTSNNTTYTLHNDAANSGGGRDLGVNSDKKWGMHASATTTELRFLPVDATAEYIAMMVTSWGETSFTFTTEDVIPSYDHVAVECNGDSYSATMTGSGPYTISIPTMDFEDYSGASLIVQWQDDKNVVKAQGAVLLPIFITGDNTDFGGYDPDILSSTDVHIVNGSTLTITTSGLRVHDLSIEGGSTLNISTTGGGGAVTFGMNSLYLRGGWNDDYTEYDMPRVYIDSKSTLTKTVNTVNFDISVDKRNYYPFAVPFPVTVSAVDFANSTLAGASTYGTHYVIKEYDGDNRAKNGTSDKNWKIVEDGTIYGESSATLQPGRGYILTAVSVPAYGGGVIRFPMSFTGAWTTKGEQATVSDVTKNAVSVTAYSGTAATADKRHAGWNLLGVPYMSCFASTSASHSEDDAFITGKMELTGDPADPYDWDEDGDVYVTVPVHDFSEYLQYNIEDDDTKLLPGWCFFVQFAKSGTLTFAAAGQEDSGIDIYAPKRATNESPVVKTGIILSDGNKSDKTTLLISDKYSSDEYEINADLEKMFGNGYTLATYSLSCDTRLAYNAMGREDAKKVIPIGFRAPEDGEYTFSLNPRYAEAAVERVDLIDYQTGEVTNLMMSNYTFSTERTQDDERFALNVVPMAKVPTGVEDSDVRSQNSDVRKIVIDDHVYIIRNGLMYDVTGKRVDVINK